MPILDYSVNTNNPKQDADFNSNVSLDVQSALQTAIGNQLGQMNNQPQMEQATMADQSGWKNNMAKK